MLRVGADHAHHPSAVNDLALITNFLYRCPYFHKNRPWSLVVRRWPTATRFQPLASSNLLCLLACSKLAVRNSLLTYTDTQFCRDSDRKARARQRLCPRAECG